MQALNEKYNTQLDNLRKIASLQSQMDIQNEKNLKLNESVNTLAKNQRNMEREESIINEINEKAMDNLAYGWASCSRK